MNVPFNQTYLSVCVLRWYLFTNLSSWLNDRIGLKVQCQQHRLPIKTNVNKDCTEMCNVLHLSSGSFAWGFTGYFFTKSLIFLQTMSMNQYLLSNYIYYERYLFTIHKNDSVLSVFEIRRVLGSNTCKSRRGPATFLQ